jgi:hypothetical protein
VKEGKLSCKHCKKEGHDDDHCWKLHPEKRPNGSKKGKGGKQLQQQHDQQTWDMIQVMRLKSQQLV